jgi:hypothetical protein
MSTTLENVIQFRHVGTGMADVAKVISGAETKHHFGTGLACAAVISVGLSILLLMTTAGDQSPLGAPHYWAWLLTALQVLALWSAGTDRWWGWLLGGAVQLPWIIYAVETSQFGFIPGCAVSAIVQLYSFHRITLRSGSKT